VVVKFHLPRLRGNSVDHAPAAGDRRGASMVQKGVRRNPTVDPSEHSRTWLREEPASDPSLFRTCETGLTRTAKRHGPHGTARTEWASPVTSPASAESRSLNPASNGDAERGNHRGRAPFGEQVASRKPHGGRIVPEADARGNARDMLTGTRCA
jgi:hypothetical protein